LFFKIHFYSNHIIINYYRILNKLPLSRVLKLEVSKKIKKTVKKITEKTEPWKKNRLKFWKNRPVRFGFGFISLKPSQTKKTKPNRFEPVFFLNRTRTGRFEPVSVFLKKFSLVIFLIKTEPNRKWSPLSKINVIMIYIYNK